MRNSIPSKIWILEILSKVDIKMEIQNENYITAVESLLTKYNSTNDADHLEIIHNILSTRQIASRFSDERFIQLNEKFAGKGFTQIIRGHLNEETGIAEFPVVGEDNNYSSIRAIVVKDGNNNCDIDDKINNKNELFQTIRLVQDEIQTNLCDPDGTTRDITILNWGLSFNIREHLLKGTRYEPMDQNFRIKGTSLHFAAVVACFSKIFNLPINSDYIFTGSFNNQGEAQRIESLKKKAKLISSERPNTKKIFISPKSKFNIDEQNVISSSDKFVEIENVKQLIEKVFDKKLEEITKLNLHVRRKLGRARIWAEYLGEKDLDFYRDLTGPDNMDSFILNTVNERKQVLVMHFEREGNYQIFPLAKIYLEFNSISPNFIILEGGVANQYTVNMMSCNQFRQYEGIIGLRLGSGQKVIVIAAPRGSALVGYKCNFF
jgi:hypothetical protein